MENRMLLDHNIFVKAGDVVAVGAVGGSLIGWLPHVAAVFTIVWTGIRIYETATVQSWIARWRKK